VGDKPGDLQRKKKEGEGMSGMRRWWGDIAGIDKVVLVVMMLVVADLLVVYETAGVVVQARQGNHAPL